MEYVGKGAGIGESTACLFDILHVLRGELCLDRFFRVSLRYGKEDEMNAMRMRFRFNPARRGLVQVLGPLEAEIMQLVWKRGQSTVKDIHRVLSRRREIAYTTVMTTMSRLAEKGILKRTRRGMAYLYRPAMSKAEFDRGVMRAVLSGLIETFDTAALDYLVEYLSEERPTQLDHLRQVLQVA